MSSVLNKMTIADIPKENLKGKRVLVRCDFNVPMDENGNITDNTRIVASLKTIRYLIENDAKVILCSHLEKKDKTNPTLEAVATKLSQILNIEVTLTKDVAGEDSQIKVNQMKDGEVILLENLRHNPGEKKNDPLFAAQLANLADIYVNDAFGTAHRAHASTEGITKTLGPNKPAVAGFLIEKELKVMGGALENPKRPFVAILGGLKVSDKINVIENLLDKVDTLIIGGAMANTFLVAQGIEVGSSKIEEDKVELAKEILIKAKYKGVKIVLPIDFIIGTDIKQESPAEIVGIEGLFPKDKAIFDIGPDTINEIQGVLIGAKTIVWNGPMGVFENDNFNKGTFQVARAVAQATEKNEAISIIGGGDSAAAVEELGFAEKMTHISTGGGASLEFLEGKILPGIDCLNEKKQNHTV